MRIFSGYRPLWLVAISLLVFIFTLLGRLTLEQPLLSTADAPEQPTRSRMNTESRIADFQDRLRLNPEDTTAYTQLGLALLQRVRETGDASLYTQAEQALSEALRRDPQQFEALIGQGLVALARHDFAVALEWGERAKAINPHNVQVYGIIGDAQIELGRYEAAAETIQTMVETRPELSSYSRVSYLRELRGDIEGAIEAMQQAVHSGLLGREETLWAQVQLGHLYFNQGDLKQAEKIYAQALSLNPDYAYALAGLARVRAAEGHYDQAIAYYEAIVEVLPLPEFVIALGDLYEVIGETDAAQQQYDLVLAMERLTVAAGMNTDLEMALFKADHALDPAQTVQQARTAYQKRSGIYGADGLAWALYQNGDYAEAQLYSQKALHLGTQDALLYFHAGMIAQAVGDTASAREYLQKALDINPHFSIRYAAQARALLAEL